MQDNFEFGPIQLQWLESLENNGHRQGRRKLGTRDHLNPYEYTACCLGELGLIGGVCHWRGDGDLVTNNTETPSIGLLVGVHEQVGLRTVSGATVGGYEHYTSLSVMNDDGMTWKQIAERVRKTPEQFFFKSV